jgi:hypothetical protein
MSRSNWRPLGEYPDISGSGRRRVWPKEDGSPTPAYRMIDLYYSDYAAVSAAVTTPEAGAFFAAMARLSTGGVRVLVSDIEVPQH